MGSHCSQRLPLQLTLFNLDHYSRRLLQANQMLVKYVPSWRFLSLCNIFVIVLVPGLIHSTS
jgi:hypothetical protein